MLSAVVITKNEQEMIEDCLVSLEFADEIIVVDTGNTDATNDIAKSHGTRVVKSSGRDYSQFRNDGLAAAKGDWILYVDADERVTPLLRQEILKLISQAAPDNAYAIPRQSILLGKEMHFGGWGSDLKSPHNSYAVRLFKKNFLKGYVGQLHEQPKFTGSLGYLTNKLIHFTHRDLSSMLDKTLEFTAYEARLRLDSGHPPVTWWRFMRVMATEFWLRFARLSAWRDGPEGIIDGLFQVFNTFVIYARLWELQHARKS